MNRLRKVQAPVYKERKMHKPALAGGHFAVATPGETDARLDGCAKIAVAMLIAGQHDPHAFPRGAVAAVIVAEAVKGRCEVAQLELAARLLDTHVVAGHEVGVAFHRRVVHL